MSFKLHHVALTVENIGKSVNWYCNIFGFKEAYRYEKGKMQIALLKLDDFYLELFHFKTETKPLPSHSRDLMSDLSVIGTKHLCIKVGNLDEVVKILRQKAVDFVTETDRAAFGGQFIFLKDCNGILIELYQE